MSWGAIGGAVVGGVISSMNSDGSGGGGGGQTASKEPWSDAAPWLRENLKTGQELQSRYAANPFSDMQKLAYGRQFGDSDYFRNVTGSMLGQLNGQRPFNRNTPDVRPTPFQFPSMAQGVMSGAAPQGGANTGGLFSSGVLAPPPPPPAAPAAPSIHPDDVFDPKLGMSRNQMLRNSGWFQGQSFGGDQSPGPGVGAGDGGGY